MIVFEWERERKRAGTAILFKIMPSYKPETQWIDPMDTAELHKDIIRNSPVLFLFLLKLKKNVEESGKTTTLHLFTSLGLVEGTGFNFALVQDHGVRKKGGKEIFHNVAVNFQMVADMFADHTNETGMGHVHGPGNAPVAGVDGVEDGDQPAQLAKEVHHRQPHPVHRGGAAAEG